MYYYYKETKNHLVTSVLLDSNIHYNNVFKKMEKQKFTKINK